MLSRSGLMTVSVQDGTYRDKLSDLVAENQCMHLSEREAAQLYGELMAALMTLQRRVREWVESRRRIRDHDKVTCRNQWDFSSYKKPDTAASVYRTQQRRQHGWRAPLNHAYAQLGSSSSAPLSHTNGVHTSLGRKPPKTTGLTDAEQDAASRKLTTLCLGEAYHGTVRKFGLARFIVRHSDPKGHLVIAVQNREGSDADIFVCGGDKEPSTVEYQWGSTGTGNDVIEIRPDDERFREGSAQTIVDDFRISVYGGGSATNECAFTITASSFRPLPGSTNVETYGNMEAIHADRRFANERRQAEARRLRCSMGQSAVALMAERGNANESTAVLTPARRLLALARLRQLAMTHLHSYLPHLQLLSEPSTASKKLPSTPIARGGSFSAVGAPAAAAAAGSGEAHAQAGSRPTEPPPPPMLMTSSSSGMLATHSGRETQREVESRHRQVAEQLYAVLKPRLVLAVEKKLSEEGIAPVTSHAQQHLASAHAPKIGGGAKRGGAVYDAPNGGVDFTRHFGAIKPPSAHPFPAMSCDWSCHVLARIGIPLTISPWEPLWKVGDHAGYVAVILSGEVVTGSGQGWHEAFVEARRAAAATAPPVDAATAIAQRVTEAAMRRQTSRQMLQQGGSQPLAVGGAGAPTQGQVHYPAEVIGSELILGASKRSKSITRATDAYACGDAGATILAVPLDVLHQLRATEPDAFLVIARLVAIGSAHLPHLAVAADEWESLSRSANRSGAPLGLMATHKAAMRQAQLTLVTAAHTIESKLGDLAEQNEIHPDEPTPPAASLAPAPAESSPSGAPDSRPSLSSAPAPAPPLMPTPMPPKMAQPLVGSAHAGARPTTTPHALRGAASPVVFAAGGDGDGRPRTAAPTAAGSGSIGALAMMSQGRSLHSSGSVGALTGPLSSAMRHSASATSLPARRLVLKSGMGISEPSEVMGVPSTPSIAFGRKAIASGPPPTPSTIPPGAAMVPSSSMPSLLTGATLTRPVTADATMGSSPSGGISASAAASEFFRRRDAEALRRQQRIQRQIEAQQEDDDERGRWHDESGAHAHAGAPGYPMGTFYPSQYGSSHFSAGAAANLGTDPSLIYSSDPGYGYAPAGALGPAALRRHAQEAYYNILADTAIAVDIELSKPGPRTLIRKERDRRQLEETERREEAAAEREARRATAVAEAATRAASSKTRRGTLHPADVTVGRRSPKGGSRPGTPSNAPGSPGEESAHGAVARGVARQSKDLPKENGPASPSAAARASASTQRKKLELRQAAFDEMRRKTNTGLRQELDRYSDERMERFRRKLTALDTRKLSRSGYQNPHREMQKVRDRAEQMAEEEA